MATTSRSRSSKRRGRQHLPNPQHLPDGRLRIRFKVNSETFDRYCPRDADADARNAWQTSVYKEIVDRRRTAEHASAVARPQLPVQLSSATMLSVALSDFITKDVSPRASERIKRRRSRGAYGYTHKDDYAALRLKKMLEALEQSRGRLAISDLRASMGCDLANYMSGLKWSPHKCQETVRMLRRFGTWCATMYEATSQIPQIATVIGQQEVYKSLIRSTTSRVEALKNLPEMASVLARIHDAEQHLLRLAVEAQYLSSARPSEVLALQAARVTEDEAQLVFRVPHKNDFRPTAEERFVILRDSTADDIRMLMSVAGEDAIFSPLMFRIVDFMKIPLDDPNRLKQIYQEQRSRLCGADGQSKRTLCRKTAAITANDYRKRLLLHGKVLPYDVRHMSISDIARVDPVAAQHAAGHKDPKTTAKYMHYPAGARKQLAARTADILEPGIAITRGVE